MIHYEKNVEQIELALASKHPNAQLGTLVLDLSKSGESKKEIYQFFFDYHQTMQETKEYLQIEKDHGEHPVELILDRLSGWCSEGAILLPDEDL